MAVDAATRLRIERLILERIAEAHEPYRRFNIREVAQECGVRDKTVRAIVQSLLDHGRIEVSPLRRHWYKKSASLPSSQDIVERLLAYQRDLERRIRLLEQKLGPLGPEGCSACGHVVDEMPLSVRRWTCPACSAEHDRDVNAARNLLAHGLAALSGPTVSSTGCEACGEAGSGAPDASLVRETASLKQEISFVPV